MQNRTCPRKSQRPETPREEEEEDKKRKDESKLRTNPKEPGEQNRDPEAVRCTTGNNIDNGHFEKGCSGNNTRNHNGNCSDDKKKKLVSVWASAWGAVHSAPQILGRFFWKTGVLALETVRLALLFAYLAWESGAASDWPVWVLVCVSSGPPDVIVITVEGVLSRLSSTMFFFLCTYFFCLVISLVALLNMSTKCYTLTDNIVVSLSSFLLCFFFMLVFYAVTKEIVGGRILMALFATFVFIVIELFLIAFTVIVLSEPKIFAAAISESLDVPRRILASIFRCSALSRRPVMHHEP